MSSSLPSFVIPGLLAAVLLAAPSAFAETKTTSPEYDVVEGAVLVFGHRLETENPLPEIGDCEGCGKIGFVSSPGGRWVLIVSDVRFKANDVWLYDTANGAMPVRLAGKRRGRHLTTTWFSDHVFELRWAGVGYSTSLLFEAAEPGAGRALDDLLFYDAARDVYVRYFFDEEAASDMVEIGAVFAPPAQADAHLFRRGL